MKQEKKTNESTLRIYFSQRRKIETEVSDWLIKNRVAGSMFNVITALHSLGYLQYPANQNSEDGET